MAERTEHDLLLERTTSRNAQIWVDLTGGRCIQDLLNYEAVVNDAHYYDIYQYVDMAQNDYLLLAGIRDKEHDLNMLEVEVEREIARLNYDTKIRVIALDTAGKNLLLKADEYDARVKEQIMLAKEYLAAVQNKELWLEKDRAEMAVEREEAKLREIQAKLLLEEYERKTVEVQIARAEVDAAKAAVQAVLAEIGKEEAKIKIITAEVEYSMAEAEKATLHADVATILAEILTKGLAKIRLDVEQAEIAKGYEWLTLYLQDMLDQWDKKLLAVNFQADSEETIGKELTALVAAKKATEDLVITKIQSEEDLWDFEKAKLEEIKTLEEMAREDAFRAKEDYEAAKTANEIKKIKKQLWAALLLNVARRWTYLNGHKISHNTDYLTQVIHQGIAGTPGFVHTITGDECA